MNTTQHTFWDRLVVPAWLGIAIVVMLIAVTIWAAATL